MPNSQAIADAQKHYPLTYPIAAGVIFMIIGIAIGAQLFASDTPAFGLVSGSDALAYFTNLFTEFFSEAISIAITVLVLDRINQNRAKEEATAEKKKTLIIQMRSKDNITAINAVDQLRDSGWLNDGSLEDAFLGDANLQDAVLFAAYLQGAHLYNANLQNATLRRANLQNTFLSSANLQRSISESTNLQNAFLGGANLKGAALVDTNMQNTNLNSANLEGANLFKTNLEGANLFKTNLRDANLEKIIFTEKTVLPDAKQKKDNMGNDMYDSYKPIYTPESYWLPQTDMSRYTDPNHPNFWQPDYLKPDYEGNKPSWVDND